MSETNMDFLMKALDNETNSNIMELTSEKIATWKNNALQKLFLERSELKKIHKKLKGYKYISGMDDLSYGHYIRWINLKKTNDFKLTNGATICDIIIVNNKVQILCKGINGRFFQILFDENMIFQKLSEQEKIILKVLDHLNST